MFFERRNITCMKEKVYEVPSEELLEQIADMYRTHGFETVIII